MSFAKIYTRGVLGLHAPSIEVEVHVSQGLPSLTIVGLPEAAVRESKDRVRSAIINSGFQFPTKRLTINLAPADLPKDGSRLDLPIALGILVASGQLPEQSTEQIEFIGELALDGCLRPVSGTLAIAMACQKVRHQLILAEANAMEAAQLSDFQVYGAQHLKQVCQHLLQQQPLLPVKGNYLKLLKIINWIWQILRGNCAHGVLWKLQQQAVTLYFLRALLELERPCWLQGYPAFYLRPMPRKILKLPVSIQLPMFSIPLDNGLFGLHTILHLLLRWSAAARNPSLVKSLWHI